MEKKLKLVLVFAIVLSFFTLLLTSIVTEKFTYLNFINVRNYEEELELKTISNSLTPTYSYSNINNLKISTIIHNERFIKKSNKKISESSIKLYNIKKSTPRIIIMRGFFILDLLYIIILIFIIKLLIYSRYTQFISYFIFSIFS